MEINRFGIHSLGSKGAQFAGPKKPEQSLLSQQAPTDSVSFSNRLGTNPEVTIAGIPVNLDPSKLSEGTLRMMQNPPKEFAL